MPFALNHKTSKKNLRRNSPSPLDLSNSHLDRASPLPTPPPSADTSFKMFWQKKKTTTESPRPYYPSETPRPILQKSPSRSSPTGIRFASGAPGTSTPPTVVVSHHTPPSISPMTLPNPSPRSSSPISVTRRSSRPTSPSASSFGARIRTSQCSISSTATMTPASPLSAAPLTGTHITTPPTAYVSTFQERAPPPPSPYRPTSERARTSTSFARPLPELLCQGEMAPRPPRHSSLFASSDSMATLPDTNVPMVNIIPATPQDNSEEFTGAWVPPPNRRSRLEESVNIEEMDEIPLEDVSVLPGLPSIDINLDFSPFSPLVDLPEEEDSTTYSPPHADLPPSPPFESYPSLPSLTSHKSMPSSDSDASMPSSSSSSSLTSFPDVEEALGSMLASLSESDILDLPDLPPAPKSATATIFTNPGLGLGLELPEGVSMTPKPTTAPLSPARRRAPPRPLDLSQTKHASSPAVNSAPPCINHRVAFYRTARAAPNSPSSGIFTIDVSEHLPLSSLDLNNWSTDVGMQFHSRSMSSFSGRDSVSLKSESSDDDLHTASIISLTPVVGDRARMVEMREEVMLPVHGEVGLAL